MQVEEVGEPTCIQGTVQREIPGRYFVDTRRSWLLLSFLSFSTPLRDPPAGNMGRWKPSTEQLGKAPSCHISERVGRMEVGFVS